MRKTWFKRLPALLCAMAIALLCAACSPQMMENPDNGEPPGITGSPQASIGANTRADVRLYTCDPALCLALSAVADRYSRQTGVRVQVLSADGDCQSALQTAMDGENPPTVFCLHSQADLEAWKDSLYDLTDTGLPELLCAEAFALGLDGRKLAIVADTRGSGLIYNAQLLARAGFARSDIPDFAQLTLVSRHITEKVSGAAAFAAPALSGTGHGDLACLLAGAAESPEALRSLWDLYITNMGSGSTGLAAYLAEECVFCPGSSGTPAAFPEGGSVDILPLYTPAGGTLRYTVELAWGINSRISAQELLSTLNFLTWLMQADADQTVPAESLGLFCPFRNVRTYSSPLEKKLREYMRTEPAEVVWQCCPDLSRQQLAALSQALAGYAETPTDEAWAAVADIFS